VRIARFSRDDTVAYGVVEESAPDGVASAGIGPDTDGLIIAELQGHPFGVGTESVRYTGQSYPVADVRLLAPVLPTKVVCIGKNYADHAREMGGEPPARPILFLKPPTSVIGPGEPIRMPLDSGRVDYEAELAVVIGTPAVDVPRERALEHVFGYTCANDVTARDQQQIDGQWTRAKGYDTFCPLGPWIETELDPGDLALRAELDGTVKQDSRTSLLLHDVPTLISYISHVMTLLPGDVILTGTPEGVGPIQDGQTIAITVEGIGTLTNPVTLRK